MRRWLPGTLAAVLGFAAVWTTLRALGAGRASDADRARSAVEEGQEGPAAELIGLPHGGTGESAAAPEPGPVPGNAAHLPEPDAADARVGGPSLVRGLVTSADDGSPQADVIVFTSDAAGSTPVVRTDEAGRFLLTGVAPGALALRTYRLGMRPGRARLRVEPGGVHTVELALADATLVQVRAADPEGTHVRELVHRITGARLSVGAIATAKPPAAVLDPYFGGNNNPYGVGALWSAQRFGLEPVEGAGALGTLAVERDPPFSVSVVVEQVPVATRRVDAAVDEVAFTVVEADLRAQLGALSLRILDATDGSPLAGTVALRRPFGGFRKAPPVRADADGIVALDGLWPGPMTVTVEAAGRASIERELTLAPGAMVELGDVVLSTPIAIAGAVLGPDDEPRAVRVACERLDADGRPARRWERASEGDGAFRFEGLPRARFVLRVMGDDEGRVPGAARTVWTSPSVAVDARGGPPADVALRAEAAVDVVVDLAGVPDGARLSVLDDGGRVLRRARPDWHVWALRLPRGAMELVVEEAGGALVARQSFVVDGTPQRLSPGRN